MMLLNTLLIAGPRMTRMTITTIATNTMINAVLYEALAFFLRRKQHGFHLPSCFRLSPVKTAMMFFLLA